MQMIFFGHLIYNFKYFIILILCWTLQWPRVTFYETCDPSIPSARPPGQHLSTSLSPERALSIVGCTALHCTALNCTLYCTGLQFDPVHYPPLHRKLDHPMPPGTCASTGSPDRPFAATSPLGCNSLYTYCLLQQDLLLSETVFTSTV